MKICKQWLVLNLAKSALNNGKGTNGLTIGNAYSAFWYPTLEGAQTKADELARGGTIGLIYESKEFRQIQPAPVQVERVECCD